MTYRGLLFAVCTVVAGCSLPTSVIGPGADAFGGPDGGLDGNVLRIDSGIDANVPDVGPLPDMGVLPDMGMPDVGPLPDTGVDAGNDAGSDAGNDAGRDAGMDAGNDAGMDAPACSGTTTRCTTGNTVLETCSAGSWSPQTCLMGCVTTGTPHCGTFDPANVAASSMPSSAAVTVSGAITILTDGCTGWSGLSGRNVTQSGGGMVCLYDVGTLTVTSAGSIRAVGTYPLVIVAQGAVSIAGTIDVGGHLVSGAGVGGGHVGGDGSAGGNNTDGGGGGGGFGGNGGNGANGGMGSAGGGGGTAVASDLEPLIGGADGGNGSGATLAGVSFSNGGHGGGAVQITSFVSIDVSGTVSAAGGGGGGGGDFGAGGGGGSGGGVLLEAPTITLGSSTTTAAVTVAGGGGGSGGCFSPAAIGHAGADGDTAGLGRAAGGAANTCSSMANDGGLGGGGGTANGANVSNGGTNPSGGGGSVGRIVFHTLSGATPAGSINPTTPIVHTALTIL